MNNLLMIYAALLVTACPTIVCDVLMRSWPTSMCGIHAFRCLLKKCFIASTIALSLTMGPISPSLAANAASSVDRLPVVNFPPSDDFWYPPHLVGKWDMNLQFDGAEFTDKIAFDKLSNNNALPGFSRYSVAFVPVVGMDMQHVPRRYVQLDSHPREDHPFNIRSMMQTALPDTVVDSAAYNFQKAPTWLHAPANQWRITYHDNSGRGEITLDTRKRDISANAGTVETTEHFTQTHTRYENTAGLSAKPQVTKSDYAMRWRLSVPSSTKGDTATTASELSAVRDLVGTLDLLAYLRPTSDLYLAAPAQPVGVFHYAVRMERVGDPAETTRATVYPYVKRNAGAVELDQYFGYVQIVGKGNLSADILKRSSQQMSTPEEKKEVNRKRSLSEADCLQESSSPTNRPKLNVAKDGKGDAKGLHANGKAVERWRPHGITEDYVNVVGEIMYPKQTFGPYGYNAEVGRFPMDRISTLGWLLCPLRKPTVIEKWSPIEVAVFEAAITLYGKNFNMIQKYVKSKTVQEVIEFYYDWKKTNHYKEWKKTFIPENRETACVYAD